MTEKQLAEAALRRWGEERAREVLALMPTLAPALQLVASTDLGLDDEPDPVRPEDRDE